MSSVSVIIPALNEAPHLTRLLLCLRQMEGIAQVIVCDGGSEDATTQVARAGGAAVVTAPRNRGAQMNAGAAVAGGDILWFLHADAAPHSHSGRAILRRMRGGSCLGGNFRLRFDAVSPAARGFAALARAQRRWGVYYGDSGIFARREVFEVLHGYQAWPLFEDYDFARRLERYARRRHCHTVRLPLPLVVSARRIQQHPWRALWLWASLQTLYSLGVPPYLLARFYHRQRS